MNPTFGNKYHPDSVLPLEYESYNTFAPLVGPILYEKIGMTPNIITFINGVLGGVLIIYLMSKKRYKLASVLLVVRQLFDVLDGYIARRYNLKSEFGNKMDAYSDKVLFTILHFIIICKLWKKSKVFAMYYTASIFFIDIQVSNKHKCIKQQNKVCKNESDRREILKMFRNLSSMELVILKAFVIYSFSYYK